MNTYMNKTLFSTAYSNFKDISTKVASYKKKVYGTGNTCIKYSGYIKVFKITLKNEIFFSLFSVTVIVLVDVFRIQIAQ